jgi:hypothetical protein
MCDIVTRATAGDPPAAGSVHNLSPRPAGEESKPAHPCAPAERFPFGRTDAAKTTSRRDISSEPTSLAARDPDHLVAVDDLDARTLVRGAEGDLVLVEAVPPVEVRPGDPARGQQRRNRLGEDPRAATTTPGR